jgi:hypothetical protein
MDQQDVLLGEIVRIKRGGSRGDSVKVYSDKPRCFIGRYEPARRERYSFAALPESGRQYSCDVRVDRTQVARHHAAVIFDAATNQARFR